MTLFIERVLNLSNGITKPKTKAMKKQELLTAISESGHRSSNLKTLMNKNKVIREAVISKGIDVVINWLMQAEVKEEIRLKKQQDKAEAKKWKMSLREYTELQRKSKRILNDFHTGHSMGCYRQLRINGKVFATNNILEEYANSSRYSPTYGGLCVDLNKAELKRIEQIEGVWTIKGKGNRAKWIESSGRKHRYKVNLVRGWLIGQSHALTIEEAERLERLKALREKGIDGRFIGLKHIKQAGACMVGIKAFAERHGLNLKYGYNLKYLKELENNSFLNKV